MRAAAGFLNRLTWQIQRAPQQLMQHLLMCRATSWNAAKSCILDIRLINEQTAAACLHLQLETIDSNAQSAKHPSNSNVSGSKHLMKTACCTTVCATASSRLHNNALQIDGKQYIK
jgi:hypothetical protein